jgi:hypothetical protein
MKTIKKKIPKFKTVNEEIEILYGKNKKPIAKIVPLLEQKKGKRNIGILKGKSKVSFAKNFKITTDELFS